MNYLELLNGLQYLWLIFFIMIVSGIAKEQNLFMPVYSYIKSAFKSNRVVLFLISAISGILPIEGRVTVSAGVLDTITKKDCSCGHDHGRQRMGIVDYLATHHYYLWSPLEKTVILPMATFGLTYLAWISVVWPILVASLLFIFYYIFTQVKEDDIEIEFISFKISAVIRNIIPFFAAIAAYIYVGGDKHVFGIFGGLALWYIFLTQTWNIKKLLSYINWDVLLSVAIVIVLGNYLKSHSAYFTELIKTAGVDPSTFLGMTIISFLGFMASFLMGSSGKFVALAVLMSSVFGPQYFLWFFAIDFAGYLLSPTHKCVMVGNKYFGTPIKQYFTILGLWAGLLLLTAGLTTFLGA